MPLPVSLVLLAWAVRAENELTPAFSALLLVVFYVLCWTPAESRCLVFVTVLFYFIFELRLDNSNHRDSSLFSPPTNSTGRGTSKFGRWLVWPRLI